MDAPTFVAIALFISACWGIQPVVHKYILGVIHPAMLISISSTIYFACMMGFAAYNWRTVKREYRKVTPRLFAIIALVTIVAAFVANLLYFFILRGHASYTTSALIYSSPFFTLLVAYLFLHERLTLYGTLGAGLIIAGVVLIAINDVKTGQ